MATNKMEYVDMEEEANQAYFQQLDGDLEYYLSQADAHDEELDRQLHREWEEEDRIINQRDKNGNYTTVRVVRIIKTEKCDKGVLSRVLKLEGHNCSLDEFLEWFLLTQNGKCFSVKNDSLIITNESYQTMMTEGSPYLYEEGFLLWVTFDEYFTAFIESMIDDR